MWGMFTMNVRYKIVLFCIVSSIVVNFYAADVLAFDPKIIHETLFDLYFPEDEQLSTTEKRKRLQYRQEAWLYLKSNPEVLGLLQLLQPNSGLFPHDIKKIYINLVRDGVQNLDKKQLKKLQYYLRRNSHNDVRKIASKIRLLYSSLAYSGSVTSKIAGYNKEILKHQVDFNSIIPSSKLVHKDGVLFSEQGEIDYLIVGSGPAGSVIAHELIVYNPQLKVVLIDAGSCIKPHAILTESSSEFMESGNMRSTQTGGIWLRNGRAFGGGTIVNLDLSFSPMLPQIQKQIQNWIDVGFIDPSLIHDGDKNWAHLQRAYDYITDCIGTRKVGMDEVNENNKILLNGCPGATTYCLNARKPKDVHDLDLKISALDVFIVPAIQRGLMILPDVKVKQILCEYDCNQPHACGLVLEFQEPLDRSYIVKDPNQLRLSKGSVVRMYAKNIIVAAGTLGSAEILLRSKIRNDMIGKGIVIHPSMGFYGRFDHEINGLQGLQAAVYAPAQSIEEGYFFESMFAEPSFIPIINFGSGKQILDSIRDIRYLGGFGVMLIDTPNIDNRVYIDPITDKVQVDYILQEHDKKRFKKALKYGLEILFDQGAYEVFLPSCEPLLTEDTEFIPFTSKQQIAQALQKLKFIENQNVISSAHMQGSNKMGSDYKTSVVSWNFKVFDQVACKEFDNLYVCDSSIFPSSVGANPMQSIYTFAKLFVNKLL